MAQKGMFGSSFQQAVTDENALRLQQAQTGGLTGWAAITNAMSGIGSEIGYQGGQAMGGQTPAQAQQADFQTAMDSFDFDPSNPDSLMEGAAVMNAAGFYDQGLEMFTMSNKVRSDNLSYDVLKMQKEKLENPDPKMIQENGVWYYVDGDNAGDRVLTADIPEKKRDMKKGADDFYRYTDGDKERVFPDLTVPLKDRPIKTGIDGFLRFLDGDKERVFPNQTAPDKERQVRESADGYYRYIDGDKERVFPDVTKPPKAPVKINYDAIPTNEATRIDDLVTEVFNTGWKGFLDTGAFAGNKTQTDIALRSLSAAVYMIARNEGMLPEEVLNIQVENDAGKDVRITPAQLMKYYSAGGIGGKTVVVNTNDGDGGDGGDGGDTKLRENK